MENFEAATEAAPTQGMDLNELAPAKKSKPKGEPKAEPKVYAAEEPKAAPRDEPEPQRATPAPRKARRVQAKKTTPAFQVIVEIRTRVTVSMQSGEPMNISTTDPQLLLAPSDQKQIKHTVVGFEIVK